MNIENILWSEEVVGDGRWCWAISGPDRFGACPNHYAVNLLAFLARFNISKTRRHQYQKNLIEQSTIRIESKQTVQSFSGVVDRSIYCNRRDG